MLTQARDAAHPLLERVKFLAITAANLDEFFMIRVATTLKKLREGIEDVAPDGYNTEQQLDAMRSRARQMLQDQAAVWAELRERLGGRAGAACSSRPTGRRQVREYLAGYFSREVSPVLTPLAFDPGHPFPFISNLSKNFAVVVRHGNRTKFARVKVPDVLPRFIPIPEALSGTPGLTFAFLEDVVRANIQELFPGTQVKGAHLFRIIRDADLEIERDEADDLLESVDRSLRQLRHGAISLLQVEADMPARVINILVENFEVTDDVVERTSERMGLADWMQLTRMHRPELRDAPFSPRSLWRPDEDPEVIFDELRYQDVLVHHPFESFASVEAFLRAAVKDPHVIAIKMTLYRTGANSPLIPLLIEAAESGKQVAVLVELKARFDERNNILWAKRLESHGIHVVYGFPDLKTHAKLCLVVRQEPDGIQRYVHTAPATTTRKRRRSTRTSVSSRPIRASSSDVSDIFNYLTGYSSQKEFRTLLVAPVQLRTRLTRADHARGRARAGRPAGAHDLQVERAHRRPDDPRALPRLTGRRLDRSDRPRHLLPASRAPRRQRQHPRPLDRRPLPRALAHLLVRERRAGGDVHRQRRPDGAEPRSARRNADAGARSRHPGAPARRRAARLPAGHRPGHDARLERSATSGRTPRRATSTRSSSCCSTTSDKTGVSSAAGARTGFRA